MKKTLSIILALIMVLSLIPVMSASAATVTETGKCGDDATYELYDNGHLIISGTGELKQSFFRKNTSIKKLTVEEGITNINSNLFDGCSNLKKAELPDSIKYISSSSFSSCSSLEEINIPENVKWISAYAFHQCKSLKKIRLPEKVLGFENGVFNGCTSLQYITILNPACDIYNRDDTISTQTKIYGYAGSTAESYAKKYNRTFIPIEENKVYPVEVPEKPASELFHGNIAHYECAVTGKLFSDSEGKNEITKESVILHNEISVPAKAATCIEEGHTAGKICSVCEKLITAVPTEINPDFHIHTSVIYTPVTESTCKVKGQGEKYIYCSDCGKEISRETNAELPLAPHTVSEWTVIKEETETEEGIRQGICTLCGEALTEAIPKYREKGMCGDNASYVIYHDGHLIISGTGAIWNYAFSGNSFIKKLTVEQGITDMGYRAFDNCFNLKQAELPDSIKNIPESFKTCPSLETIEIPENTETIGRIAFLECEALKKIRLPETVNTLGPNAFQNCTGLQYITVLNPSCVITDNQYTIPGQAKIYGYAGSTAESYAEKYNRTFIPIEENKVYPAEVPEKPASDIFHGNIAHYECAATGKLFSDSEGKNEITKESIIIHNGIYVPEKSATCMVKGHTAGLICSACGKFITAVPTDINPDVHNPCKPIYVPVTESTCTVKGQGEKYIYCKDCGKEISREINAELPLAPHAVSEWTVVKDETDTEEGLKQGVCTVCGETVTEAIPVYKEKGQCGDNAFYKLYPDGHLIISGTGIIWNYNFDSNKSVKKLTIEKGITDTGSDTFRDCSHLKKAELPDGITINSYSFCNCSSLEEINIPENTERIYDVAFYLTSLKKIRLPEKLNTIGDCAFENCKSLQYITILNPACDIFDSEDTIPEQAKIYGYAGSTAESYATKYNRTFIPIEENKFYPEEIPAAEATDAEHGNIKYYECAVTGKLFSDIECTNEITIEDTVTHNTRYIIPGKAATCTETGLTEGRRCSVCGKITVPQEVIPATGHTEEILPAVAPTCTKTGLTEGKKCSVCGEILVPQTVIEAAGHTEEIIPAVAPTCTETGLTEGKKCSVCGEILVSQTAVDALGHKDADSDGKCDVCGEQLTEPEEKPECKHMCHSENRFVQFIWKIVNFFNKLFKINQYCECGARHW